MTNILIIDDDVTFCLMLETYLKKHNFKVTNIYAPKEVYDIIKKNHFDIVLTDWRLPDMDGMEVIKIIKKHAPETQIIMMTNYANYASAIQSIKEGAFSYMPKPFNPEDLLNLIKEALTEKEKKVQKKQNKSKGNFFEGKSPAFESLLKYINLVAPTSMSVLINGESGTGKEYVARKIHEMSSRNKSPFIAVDCGAIPKDLASSEFFGHIKGAFTGAVFDKKGCFELANGGTLFLDEIGNLQYETQIQLLRAIQERIVHPVGSDKTIPIDVRIIAATNENLKSTILDGSFRGDLYHRLNEFEIMIPPLRERVEDILPFAQFFLDQANQDLDKTVTGFDHEVEKVFSNYNWPGNLREMKNMIKRATLLNQNGTIGLSDISPDIYNSGIDENNLKLTKQSKENEKDIIEKTLEKTNYNKSKAARLLNIDRKTLYNKLKLHSIATEKNTDDDED